MSNSHDLILRNVSIVGSHLKVVEEKLKLHKADKVDQGNYACMVTLTIQKFNKQYGSISGSTSMTRGIVSLAEWIFNFSKVL